MDDIKGLVPEIYYDMIARVAAGVPLVAIIISPQLDKLDALSSVAAFLVLIGLGYIAGHILTTVSIVMNVILWNPPVLRFAQYLVTLKYGFRSKWTLPVFDVVYQRIDWAAKKDANAGAILKKMEAGAALADNLLSGWIVILLYYAVGGKIGWAIDLKNWNCSVLILVTLVLIASVYARRGTFVVRQDRLLQQLDSAAPTQSVPT